jgi:hypothetical protein
VAAGAANNNTSLTQRPFVSSLGEAYQRNWENIPCVFVLSTGRTGTETLSALLGLSEVLDAHHEPKPRLTKTSFDAFLGYDELSVEVWKKIILAARDDFIAEAACRGKIYVETNNRMTYLAPALTQVFPSSRFIHLYRNPIDVIRSAMRRKFYVDHPWDFARIRPKTLDNGLAVWPTWRPIQKAAWYWAQINADIISFLDTLPNNRYFRASSEEIFSAQPDTLERLFKFVGSEIPKRNSISRVLKRKLNAQRTGHFPPGRKWPDADYKDVVTIVGPVAERLGYKL